ncbi:hypothetical protein FY528_11260 [Hymenobacter lutimineralis]|uniref:Uncharacterized protein n=1 Tax=Hymenobacter lutimineralis TaxID=2606448 RepID=A0A5D6V291_9BACT|nr:hypothetical protein [Hymenobacter lutimineralis]TYZ09315.1 hypothetical protein FY528_11260 [Hymenobacter lutimineralis]
MPLDYTTLSDRAQCDAATAEVDFELRSFSVRDSNLDLADERAERTQTSTAAQLARVEAKIASNDILLATAGIDEETRETATDERAALLVQRTRLQKRARQAQGVSRFLADVDVEQIAKQVEVLTAVKAGIATHRATLPA